MVGEVVIEVFDLEVEVGSELVAEVLGRGDVCGFAVGVGEVLNNVEEFLGVGGVGEDFVVDESPLGCSDSVVVVCHGILVGGIVFGCLGVSPVLLQVSAGVYGILEIGGEPGSFPGALFVGFA